jgi:hypothetical protein
MRVTVGPSEGSAVLVLGKRAQQDVRDALTRIFTSRRTARPTYVNILLTRPLQVYKLMVPHFRYTLNINRNARSSLINAGGIIEKSFSAGAYAMRLASVVYGKYWNFATEALPEDLRARYGTRPLEM